MGKNENISKTREKNVEIFKESMEFIKNNQILSDIQKSSIDRTTLILEKTSDAMAKFLDKNIIKNIYKSSDNMADIKVTKNRTFEAVHKLKKDNTVVLNFASATTPGGGVLLGSSAQEESLCRVSTLYSTLNSVNALYYYNENRKYHNRMYKDNIIYSPGVIIFRNDDFSDMHFLKSGKWYDCNVITCPAPNLRQASYNRFNPDDNTGIINQIDMNQYEDIMKNRIRRILAVANRFGNKHIILGAFGCGAFQNDPNIVSRLFKEVIIDDGFGYLFDYIEFAVYCRPYDKINYDAFYNTFKKYIK